MNTHLYRRMRAFKLVKRLKLDQSIFPRRSVAMRSSPPNMPIKSLALGHDLYTRRLLLRLVRSICNLGNRRKRVHRHAGPDDEVALAAQRLEG